MALVERLRAAGGERLLDVQWTTPHLRTLGARDMARPEYLRRLEAALDAAARAGAYAVTAAGSSTRRGSSVSRAITSRWICDVPS